MTMLLRSKRTFMFIRKSLLTLCGCSICIGIIYWHQCNVITFLFKIRKYTILHSLCSNPFLTNIRNILEAYIQQKEKKRSEGKLRGEGRGGKIKGGREGGRKRERGETGSL